MGRALLRLSLLNWLRKHWHSDAKSPQRQRRQRQLRPTLDFLEDRVVPSTLTDSLGALTINLDMPGEQLTISGNGGGSYNVASSAALFAADLTGATYTPASPLSGTLTISTDDRMSIIDDTTGTSVVFGSSSGVYSQPITVDLTNPLSGNVSFTGSATFADGLNVTTADGNINDPSSAITVNSGNLELTASQGTISIGGFDGTTNGSTTFDAAGSITASNTGNNFGNSLTLQGGQAGATAAIACGSNPLSLQGTNYSGNLSLTYSGNLSLTAGGTVDVGGSAGNTVGGNLTVTAGEAISDSDGITVGGAASFSTAAGGIDLDDSANVFNGDVSAAVDTGSAAGTGTDNISIGWTHDPLTTPAYANFQMGTIDTNGAGNLTLNEYGDGGSITEDPAGGGITTAGNVTIQHEGLYTGEQNVDFLAVSNNIGGTVTVNGYAGIYGDFALSNSNADASVGNLSFSDYPIESLSLNFETASIAIDSLASIATIGTNSFTGADAGAFDNLSLTATSISTTDSVDASSGVIVSGTVSLTATNGSITASNVSNNFSVRSQLPWQRRPAIRTLSTSITMVRWTSPTSLCKTAT